MEARVKLWRLVRVGHAVLDGTGTLAHGGRYSPPGLPVVNFASEPGLSVLIALRYLPRDLSGIAEDYVLGWTEIAAVPERVPAGLAEEAIRDFVGDWLESRRSLLMAVPSRVLPEGDVVMMNPRHPAAVHVPALTTRPFSFAQCLHTPPMAARYAGQQ